MADPIKPPLTPTPLLPTQPAAPLPPGGQSPPNGSVDLPPEEAIFSFFKKYIGLLTAVGSLPLVVGALGVFPEPDPDLKLSILASFLCILSLGMCILQKRGFAALTLSKSMVERSAPVWFALLFLLLGVILVGDYKDSGFFTEMYGKTTIYLLIMPLFVASLGFILMASYTQFYGAEIQKTIESSIKSHDQLAAVKSLLTDMSLVYKKFGSPPFKDLTTELLEQFSNRLSRLARGQIKASGAELREIFPMLHQHFKKTYAVSNRDMNFWVDSFSRPDSADVLYAREYLKLNLDAISAGGTITRIFILDDADLGHASMAKVLEKQFDAGIGWAICLYEELPTSMKVPGTYLDFALYDRDKACTFFLDARDQRRQFKVLLNDGTSAAVKDNVETHAQLLKQVWIATDRFLAEHPTGLRLLGVPTGTTELRQGQALPALGTDSIVVVRSREEISEAIQIVNTIRRNNMAFWGEVASRFVLELEGKWVYTVSGQRNTYQHHGTCEMFLRGKSLVVAGVRLETSTKGADGQWTKEKTEARWNSSPVEFNGDRMEFKYKIVIKGVEYRGVCYMDIQNTDLLKGELYLIESPEHTINAVIEMKRDPNRPERLQRGTAPQREPDVSF